MNPVWFTLLNTRPVHQAGALTQEVQLHNGQVIQCPTIEIQWRSCEDTIFDLLQGTDKIIFISANAVQGFLKSVFYQHYLKSLKTAQRPIELYAIGRATQQSGLADQLPLTVLSQTHFDSEHFLAHPVMQQVNQQSIAIVKGQGGRSLLEDTLQKRGAKVQPLEVYRRVSAPFCADNWLTFVQSHNPVLLLTSVESFNCLLDRLTQFDPEYAELKSSKWAFLTETIVFSARIKDHMQAQGWSGPARVVSEQSNAGIIDTLLTMKVEKDSLNSLT